MLETLNVHENSHSITITLSRESHKNSINKKLLEELNTVLDYAEGHPTCNAIIVQGQHNFFCSGADLHEIASLLDNPKAIHEWATLYMATLKRLTLIPKLIIALVNGRAIGGGVGLAAASDYVIATHSSQFKLTELYWGLLPAMVTPYLIRRTGFQRAYMMSLTCRTLTATEAYNIHLVDELNGSIEESLHTQIQRVKHFEKEILRELKGYFNKMWMLDEEMEKLAIDKTTSLFLSEFAKTRIRDFVENKTLPWQEFP